ncbi:MAG: DUF6341 family protein [Flavobacterium sp.]|jgi:hypothetical protein
MKTLFESIEFLFVEVLFLPLDFLRKTELSSWTLANIFNWLFMIICAYYMVYWMKQLKEYKKNNEDDQDTSAHSFLN